MLASGNAHAAAFVTATHRSMSELELDDVYAKPLDELFKKLATATVAIPGSTGSGGADWKAALRDAETLLGLTWVSAPSRQLKPQPQGEAVRRVLGRRMAEEATLLRSNRWSARDAEVQGCLRLFSPSPPGLTPSRSPSVKNNTHHNDGASTGSVQREVGMMHAHLRQLMMAALLKDSETRTHGLHHAAFHTAFTTQPFTRPSPRSLSHALHHAAFHTTAPHGHQPQPLAPLLHTPSQRSSRLSTPLHSNQCLAFPHLLSPSLTFFPLLSPLGQAHNALGGCRPCWRVAS